MPSTCVMYRAAFGLQDDTAPVFTAPRGRLTDGRRHGSQAVSGLTFSASDVGGGLYQRAVIEVDGRQPVTEQASAVRSRTPRSSRASWPRAGRWRWTPRRWPTARTRVRVLVMDATQHEHGRLGSFTLTDGQRPDRAARPPSRRGRDAWASIASSTTIAYGGKLRVRRECTRGRAAARLQQDLG